MSEEKHPLLDWVKTYADLGWHRTGTDVDRNTFDWLFKEVLELDGRPKEQSYEFPFYSFEVKAAGFHIEPLYYSFEGEGEAINYLIERLDFDKDHGDDYVKQSVEVLARKAQSEGADGLVLLTGDENSNLVAINQTPKSPGALPIFLLAGKDHERFLVEKPLIKFSCSLSSKASRNLVAEFGDFSTGAPPLMVTTPMSGWFTCAGERGTGLAIALSVAAEIGQIYPVLLLCPSGHELGYWGAHRFAENFDGELKAILHIGSCAAIKIEADPMMVARSNLQQQTFDCVSEIMFGNALTLERPSDPLDPKSWFGEAECWAPKAMPMVSVAGLSRDFHQISDTSDRSTNQQALDERLEIFKRVARALFVHIGSVLLAFCSFSPVL